MVSRGAYDVGNSSVALELSLLRALAATGVAMVMGFSEPMGGTSGGALTLKSWSFVQEQWGPEGPFVYQAHFNYLQGAAQERGVLPFRNEPGGCFGMFQLGALVLYQ